MANEIKSKIVNQRSRAAPVTKLDNIALHYRYSILIWKLSVFFYATHGWFSRIGVFKLPLYNQLPRRYRSHKASYCKLCFETFATVL